MGDELKCIRCGCSEDLACVLGHSSAEDVTGEDRLLVVTCFWIEVAPPGTTTAQVPAPDRAARRRGETATISNIKTVALCSACASPREREAWRARGCRTTAEMLEAKRIAEAVPS